jgi:plasmid stabilization system protein ParE
MNPYGYEWSESAQNRLIEIWINAQDRNAVSRADSQAEKILKQQPRTAGRELSEGLWQIIVPPLKIFYEIDEDKRIVTVTHVDT